MFAICSFFPNFNIHILCKRKVQSKSRYSPPEVFLGKSVLKIYRKSTGEHPCQSVISIKLQSKFIEIVLRHGCSLVNLLHIFRTPFLKNNSEVLLLDKETLACNFIIKKNFGTGVFLWILIISKNTFSYRTPPMAASDHIS